MKKSTLILSALFPLLATAQQKTEVKDFNLTGPFAVSAPLCADSVDLNGNHFDDMSILNGLNLTATSLTTNYNGALLPSLSVWGCWLISSMPTSLSRMSMPCWRRWAWAQ